MKQAILVINRGRFDVLQKTIEMLDDYEIDFFIYGNNNDSLVSNKSRLFFVGNKKINPQTYCELLEEKTLIKKALENNYDYFHLISSDDLPLMDKFYFKKYFSNMPIKLGFVEKSDVLDLTSLSFYYPFNNFNYESKFISFLFVKLCMAVNHILKINRINDSNVIKGCPYFSLPRKYVESLNDANISSYKWTINPKNFFAQTVLLEFKEDYPSYTIYSSRYNLMKAYTEASRLSNFLKLEKTNWFDELDYKYNEQDIEFLKSKFNTEYAFVHSIGDINLKELDFSDVKGD
ncbi:hypothetical protein AP1H75_12480 [Apilactobacillus apinorum]|uniref:hypothetical protein n=1 Tax=Apilactobacillus apinorum TaxID=1218495 RepID=UPI0030E82AB7